jgi:hypothetical protein
MKLFSGSRVPININMNVIEYRRGAKSIAYCIIDNTADYKDGYIVELMKNISDYTISNLYGEGYDVFVSLNEDSVLSHVANLGYQHAVVFSTGTEFINGANFFKEIEKICESDFFIYGHILDRQEAYYELHHQCYLINLEKYNILGQPLIGFQELGSRHTQITPIRTIENLHDDYTPLSISFGSSQSVYKHKMHGHNLISKGLIQGYQIVAFSEHVRQYKKYYYPENPTEFLNQISWAYARYNYCMTEFVHTSHTEIFNINDTYDQLVITASGVELLKYLNPDANVIMYDYNQAALDYWQENVPVIKNVNFQFVLCDLLGEDNLADYINPIPNTLVHLSNIFNYEGTNFFYSLDYRKYKETKLLSAIESKCPTAEIYFNLEASIFNTVPTWHINS